MTAALPRRLSGWALALSAGLADAALAEPVPTSTVTTATAAAPAPVRFHPDDPAADHTGTPAGPVPGGELPVAGGAEPGGDRPLPLYDGRPPPEPGARELLIWVPRAVFLPAWVVLEYGLRWPVVKLLTWNEEEKILARIGNLLSFRDGRSFIAPTALIDFGLRPSVGFLSGHAELFHPEHTLTLRGAFWAEGWVQLSAESRWSVFQRRGALSFRAHGGTRPDEPYYGTGFAARERDRTFLRVIRGGGELSLDATLGGLSRAGLVLDGRQVRLEDGQAPRYGTVFSPQGQTGFAEAYTLLGGRAFLAVDSRPEERERSAGTGLRSELSGGYEFDPGPSRLSFFRLTGEVSGFWDVSGRNHVLALQLYTDLVARTTDTPLPLVELPALGGDEVLRGFLRGRFRAESTVSATLSYRYPIWILVDAELFVGVGNAFGRALEGFRWDRLALSAGTALRMGLSRDTSVDLLVGFGTNTFAEGDFGVKSGRFSVGVNHGF